MGFNAYILTKVTLWVDLRYIWNRSNLIPDHKSNDRGIL